jgi:hypothetical protein
MILTHGYMSRTGGGGQSLQTKDRGRRQVRSVPRRRGKNDEDVRECHNRPGRGERSDQGRRRRDGGRGRKRQYRPHGRYGRSLRELRRCRARRSRYHPRRRSQTQRWAEQVRAREGGGRSGSQEGPRGRRQFQRQPWGGVRRDSQREVPPRGGIESRGAVNCHGRESPIRNRGRAGIHLHRRHRTRRG